ncbi:hypothetical protein FBU30_001570 [Linnemannia zychae]|nr:hypothetical protein FBU30_001570 [Linnemannia zychae]
MPLQPYNIDLQAIELPGTRRSGQTGIYRQVGFENELATSPPGHPHVKTVYEWFQDGERAWDAVVQSYGAYQWETYAEIAARSNRFGSGLLHLHQQAHGLSEPARGWSVGIWAINRAKWRITDIACVAYNLVSVGLYDTLGPDAVAYAKPSPLPNTAPVGSVLRIYAADKGIQLLDWDEVEALGQERQRRHSPPQPSDVFTICYTSGTTGMPKGAMITHENVVSTIASANTIQSLDKDELAMYGVGGQVGYWTGDVLRVLEDLAVLQPTFFPTVPRLLNRIYARIQAATVEAPGLVGILARKAVATKIANLNAGLGNKHALWDRLLFNKVRMALGGRVNKILTDSAPIAEHVLSFLRIALIVDIAEAYGQTESTASGTMTRAEERKASHVGPPSPNCEIKLVDVPGLNYFATDQPYPRGEVCYRGPSVFNGYLKDEEKTREAIDEEGWLHSGDVSFIKENGTLTIIDRVKNVFKLSIGEYVAIEKVEYQISTRLPIAFQLFVHGDSLEACLVAILVPDPDAFPAFANKVLGSKSNAFISDYQDPKLRRAVLMGIALAGQEAGLKSFEIPKAVFIEPNPFTVEGGILTPTLKIKRPVAVKTYRQQLDELYREIKTGVNSKL